jgi:hypothetical protein
MDMIMEVDTGMTGSTIIVMDTAILIMDLIVGDVKLQSQRNTGYQVIT